jgi:hypothetical protein
MTEQYCVVYWEYGYHCDEFDFVKVVGPMDYEEAEKLNGIIDMEGISHTTIVPFETWNKVK